MKFDSVASKAYEHIQVANTFDLKVYYGMMYDWIQGGRQGDPPAPTKPDYAYVRIPSYKAFDAMTEE